MAEKWASSASAISVILGHETCSRQAFHPMAGFTTVRSAVARDFIDVDLRDAINAGLIVGRRIIASGPGITTTGGHIHETAMAVEATGWAPSSQGSWRISPSSAATRRTTSRPCSIVSAL